MRILKVGRVDLTQGFPIFCGVVEGFVIRTGDDVVLLTSSGERETGLITSVAVDDPTEGSIGARMLDEGKVGQGVRLTVRLPKKTTVDSKSVVAFEKPAAA